jgi:hypothetical protein
MMVIIAKGRSSRNATWGMCRFALQLEMWGAVKIVD